ncbi:TPA: histidine kinase [Neisseria meningitidis]
MVISNPRELEKLKDRIPNLINIIRVAIVFPLMIMHILGLETGSRANLHASWTAWAFYVWLAIACWLIFFSIIHPHWQWQALRIPSFSAVADITMIGVLTYLFGGIDSGFGILILPFVVCSCLLSYGRYPLLYASYAAILLIFNAIADGDIGKYPHISDARTASVTFILVAASYLSAIFTSLSVRYIDSAGRLARDNHLAYRRIKGCGGGRSVQRQIVQNHRRQRLPYRQNARRYFLANKRNKTERETIGLIPFWEEFKQEFLLGHPDAAGCIRLDMQGNHLTAYFDPAHLRQIMWNLANNAWRHSSKRNGSIAVVARPAQKNTISILFSDDGGGVPPEVQEHLFEPFYTTAENGTGLGLYVARELAHANFGDLTYLPEAKCFELTLPEKTND